MKYEIALAVVSSEIASKLLDEFGSADSTLQLSLNFNIAVDPLCKHWKNIWNGNCIENMPTYYLRWMYHGSQERTWGSWLYSSRFPKRLISNRRSSSTTRRVFLSYCARNSTIGLAEWVSEEFGFLETCRENWCFCTNICQITFGYGRWKRRLILQHNRYRSHQTYVNFSCRFTILKKFSRT